MVGWQSLIAITARSSECFTLISRLISATTSVLWLLSTTIWSVVGKLARGEIAGAKPETGG